MIPILFIPHRKVERSSFSVASTTLGNAVTDSRTSSFLPSCVLCSDWSAAFFVGASDKRTTTAEAAQPDFVSQLQLRKVRVGQQRWKSLASCRPGSLFVCGRDSTNWWQLTVWWNLTYRWECKATLIATAFDRVRTATLESGQSGIDGGLA